MKTHQRIPCITGMVVHLGDRAHITENRPAGVGLPPEGFIETHRHFDRLSHPGVGFGMQLERNSSGKAGLNAMESTSSFGGKGC